MRNVRSSPLQAMLLTHPLPFPDSGLENTPVSVATTRQIEHIDEYPSFFQPDGRKIIYKP